MKKSLFCAFVTLCLVAQHVFAVPANPAPLNYRLPDGSEITILLRGDERINWQTSFDGYALLFNKDGYLEYATHDASGDLKASGLRAHNEAERSVQEKEFLKKQAVDARYSESQVQALLELKGMRKNLEEATMKSSRKITGNVRAPLILIGFLGTSFNKTQEDFQALMNNLNYTTTADGSSITGSVRDYFGASSRGKLDFQVDVFGPYSLPNSVSVYDANSALMCRAAVDSANAHGCNFSDYDLNGDGKVDGIHIIFAGFGQESCGGTRIWSHMSDLNNYYPYMYEPYMLDGKNISRYSCSPELRGCSGSYITYIGVIAHELSHVFGLPDLYDSDYNEGGGTAIDMGAWDIMAQGSWNDGGRTPSHHSAYCQEALGWIIPIDLESPQHITLPNPADTGLVYRIHTSTPGEYFLLENRQKLGWDYYVPGNGLLIYHADNNIAAWNRNCGNCSPVHRGLYVKQAGCSSAESDCSTRTTDPFPRTGKTSFTDNSVPASISWNGENTNKPVTSIVHNTSSRTITFSFMGAESYLTLTPNEKQTFNVNVGYETVTPISLTVTNNSNTATERILISLNGSHSNRFSLSQTSIMSLAAGASETFTVAPKTGYRIGTYTANLTISDGSVGTGVDLVLNVDDGTSVATLTVIDPLKAWIENETLHINGLQTGQTWRIYSVSGTLLHQDTATSNEEMLNAASLLQQRGTYIIQTDNGKSIKIVY